MMILILPRGSSTGYFYLIKELKQGCRQFFKSQGIRAMTKPQFNNKLTLPCGSLVGNRFLKSAMSEALASKDHAPGRMLERLYATWSEGGAGILVTGNVMIDSSQLGEPGNVAVENETHMDLLKSWAKSGTSNGNHLWVQLNHPGKQSPGFLNPEPVAPSAVPLKLKGFKPPRALEQDEIQDIVYRFGRSAAIVKKAGFTGVQIHGAHGYLVSQFLSPYHNRRNDEYGGDINNRVRFLIQIYSAIRDNVGPDFPISIKINSADFQRGGFTEDESLHVIKLLADMGIDLIEISGGNYEAPAMMSVKNSSERTRSREAYFLNFAGRIRVLIDTPLVVTGGFRSAKAMSEALQSGALDIIGVARPMVLNPDMPNRILSGEDYVSPVKPFISTGIKALDRALMINLTWYTRQLALIGSGKTPRPDLPPLKAAFDLLLKTGWQNFVRTRA